MTLTIEELKYGAEVGDLGIEAVRAVCAEALANREAQPVAYMYKDNIHADARFSLYKRFGNWSQEDINNYEITEIPLYTVPPAPAVPDDYQHLKNVRELYRSQEKRLFALAQRIKGASFDKYSHTTAQAIDVLEREIFGEDGGTCRAAMLDQPVSSGYKLPDGWNG
ncbi:hypothetical protein JY466_08540 [Serratia marcescens]|nr:hypothetical protein [Serratia marcescens]MBN5194678.1 hypothetical protein [Serratia marcescens]